ncbi:toll-like receptor 2 type-2 [Glandiceps talaboti]
MPVQMEFRYLSMLYVLLVFGLTVSPSGSIPCKIYNYTYIDCTHRELYHLPNDLPPSTTHLELSYNTVSNLSPDSFLGLGNLVDLRLSHSSISTLGEHVFSSMVKLEVLDLSSNQLTTLSSSTFSGLHNLQQLYLFGNNLSELPNDIFADLTKLRKISLSRNNFLCFTLVPLQQLINVEVIYFDSNTISGNCTDINFQSFKKLQSVSLNNCGIDDDILSRIQFDDIEITELNLNSNGIVALRPEVFTNLNHVMSLDLSNNLLTTRLIESLDVLYVFKNSSIKTLKLNNQRLPLNFITNNTFRGLRDTSLEELYLRMNNLTSLPDGGFQWLPHLKLLDIGANKLISLSMKAFEGLPKLLTLNMMDMYYHEAGSLDVANPLEAISGLSALENLSLRGIKLAGEIPSHAFAKLSSLKYLDLASNRLSLNTDSFSNLSQLRHLDISYNSIRSFPQNVFSDLVSLEFLELSGSDVDPFEIENTHLLNNLKNLKTLNLPLRGMTYLHRDELPSLQELYIIGDDSLQCLEMSQLVERYPPSLTKLAFFSHCVDFDITDVTFLNITFIGMFQMSLHFQDMLRDSQFLSFFPNLEELSIIWGNLQHFDFHPSELNHLRTLELTGIKVSNINPQLIPTLQYLNIQESPFDCSKCNMETFVKWMKTDKVVSLKYPYLFSCATPKNKAGTRLYDLDFGWECNVLLTVSVTITCIFAFITICISLCVKFRWYIRHAIFQIKLKGGGYQLQVNVDEEEPLNKKYDAFVCYSKDDRPWVMEQLVPNLEKINPPNFKLCLHERDFMPGADIFDNIIYSIENSHKTMLILSPGFAESEWCYYEMRMAQNPLFADRRDVLVLVLLEHIPDDKMPRNLRSVFLTKNYITWPDNNIGRKLFWERLKLKLRSKNRVNRRAEVRH